MNLQISIENLHPKNHATSFEIAATDELHDLIAEPLAEIIGRSLTDVVRSLEREDIVWAQGTFKIRIKSDDGSDSEFGSREVVTEHLCKHRSEV